MGFVGLTNYKKNSERFPNKHHITFADNKTLVKVTTDFLTQEGLTKLGDFSVPKHYKDAVCRHLVYLLTERLTDIDCICKDG